jgi:hypothetical protein
LYSRNFTAALERSAVLPKTPNQEVHRDQHGLEEHVEQQHVQRDERHQHHALDRKRQREVRVHRPPPPADLVAGVVPAGDDQQRYQHGRQHHDGECDAVDAEDVARPERRYPPVVFDELILFAARFEPDRDHQRHRKDGE